MKYRGIVIFLFLLLSVQVMHVSAAESPEYIISKIKFDITGKTLELVLRNELDIKPKAERFSSEEAMAERLQEGKQKLFNRRIFKSVDVSYELIDSDEQANYYEVTYIIEDAFSILPLPFAKYDSNYGIRGGVKYYDKNFYGTLTDAYFVGFAEQINNSWDDLEYTAEMHLVDIPLRQSRVDLSASLTIEQYGDLFQNGEFTSELDWKDIGLLGTNTRIHSSLSMEQKEDNDLYVWENGVGRLDISMLDLRLFNHSLGLTLNAEASQSDNISWENPDLSFSGGLIWGGSKIFNHPFSTTLGYGFDYDTELEISSGHTARFGVRTDFQLPFSLQHTLASETILGDTEFLLNDPRQEIRSSLKGGSINWVENFRKGYSLKIENSLLYHYDFENFEESLEKNLADISRLSFTAFIPLGSFINIGTHGTGFFSYYSDELYYPGTTESAGEHMPAADMRGILNNSFPSYSGKWGGVINANLTVKTIDIDGFAEFLLSPFVDMGFFHAGEDTDLTAYDEYYSGGVEAYLIFDKFRSYPFVASLGIDLQDGYEYYHNERELMDIEYEISLSLSMMY